MPHQPDNLAYPFQEGYNDVSLFSTGKLNWVSVLYYKRLILGELLRCAYPN